MSDYGFKGKGASEPEDTGSDGYGWGGKKSTETESYTTSSGGGSSYDGGGYSGGYSGDYDEIRRDLWRRILFCMAGWAIACVGFFLMDNHSLISMLLIMVGVVIVELPCYKVLLAGGSIVGLISATFNYTIVTKWSDGSTTEDNSARAAGGFLAIISWVITLFVGIIIVVVGIFKDFFKLMKIQKEEGLKPSIKEAAWLPIAAGIGFFILGIIVVAIASAIRTTYLNNRDEYTDEETIAIIDSLVTDMEARDFVYRTWYWPDEEDATEQEYYVVEHDAGGKYQITLSDKAKNDYKLTKNIYRRLSGAWYDYTGATLGDAVSETEQKTLDAFTFAELIGYKEIKENPAIVTMWADHGSVAYGLDEPEIEANVHTRNGKNGMVTIIFGKDGLYKTARVNNTYGLIEDSVGFTYKSVTLD